MKKTSVFAVVAIMLLTLTQLSFAQNANQVQTMTGFRGVALRTYCSFSGLFRAENSKCFDASKVNTVNTASVGAIDAGTNSPATTPAPSAPGAGQASIGGFPVQTSVPQVIERTVIVQGTPGPQGPAGRDGQSAFGAFTNVPTVFWSGGGGSSAPVTTVVSGTSLPSGALPGQVLTTNASGTVEWQFIALPSATNSPLVLGSLANLSAINGLTLATTSTSTTLEFGGALAKNTLISQDSFDLAFTRGNFSFLNQGTTTIPGLTISGVIEVSQFTGLSAQEGTNTVFAGIQRRNAPAFPLYEVQAFDSATNGQSFLAVGGGVSQMGIVNASTTNQVRTDGNRIRLSSITSAAPSSQITVDGTGISFAFATGSLGAATKTYSFPRADGASAEILTTDGSGQLAFRSLASIIASSSSTTLPAWSLAGNTSTNPLTDFLGTTDAQPLVFRTNNAERLRVDVNGNVGIGTTTPMRPLTVVADVGGTLSLLQNSRVDAPAGLSLQATRADSSLSNRLGLFVNPNTTGDDRLAIPAVTVGDLWSFTKNGDLVGSLGTSFNQRTDATQARLSVLANDTRPVALFENTNQSVARFKANGAFSQTYDVGVESVGGTFNIFDSAASKNRLSINRNGNVQIYDMLNVGSYGFGLGNAGDAGFGRSDQAYMRYVQRAHIADSALELFDYNSQLSTRISQSSNGTPTEFNRTNKDIDFRIAGQTDNNLLFVDASLNKIGIGTNIPTEKLELAGNFKIRTDDKIIFENGNSDWITSGATRDMTRSGRSLQFWTANNVHMQINDSGDFAWNTNGSGDRTFELRPSNAQVSNVLVMKQNPNQGIDTLFAVNGLGGGYFSGNVGIGTITPQYKLDVAGNAQIGQVRISNSLAGFPSPTNAIEFFHGGNLGGGNAGTGIIAGGQTNQTKLLLSSANMDGSGQFDHHQLGRILVPGNGQGIAFRSASGINPTAAAFQWTVGDTNPAITTQYERMVLTQDGSLGIGTNAPSRQLHVVSTGTGFTNGRVARFDNSSATCFINPSFILGIQCSSDATLKKAIAPIETSLASLTKLKPSLFRWANEDDSTPLQYGFIAQEVEEVFPSFVTTDADTGLKSVAFGSFIPVTVKSIQEINTFLGDASNENVSGTEFATSTIFKRIAAAFKEVVVVFKEITADKATVKELCLPKSDGTTICLSGDQVAAIAALANTGSVTTSEPVGITPTPTVTVDETVVEETPAPTEEVSSTPAQDDSQTIENQVITDTLVTSEIILPTVTETPVE